MTADQLLQQLRDLSVGLSVEGDTLKCKAPRGVLTPDLVAAMRDHKAALIALLAAETALPPSYAQRQLWVLDQSAPGNPFYNNPIALRLTGTLDLPALRQSLATLLDRQRVLRARFPLRAGEPVYQEDAVCGDLLPVTDLTELPEAERAATARAEAEQEARTPFDLARGPLIRVRLLRLQPTEHLWLVTLHHIIADGWSIGVFFRELSALYAAFSAGEADPLPPLPMGYADYIRWQQKTRNGAELDRQRAYWREALAGVPPVLALPTEVPRPPLQSHRGAHVSALLPEAAQAALKTLSRSAGVTAFPVLMAAFAVVLWRYSGQQDFCIGTPFANRPRQGLEGLIGHFINTIAIRTPVDPDVSALALIARVQTQLLAAMAHQDLPFEAVVEAVNPPRDASYAPLFQVMMIYQNTPGGGLALPGLTIDAIDTSSATAKLDLTVEVFEAPEGLRLGVEYALDLFSEPQMRALIDHIGQVLIGMAAHPSAAVRGLTLLTAAEETRLRGFGGPCAPAVDLPPVHRLIERQALAAPEADAVIFNGGRWSYRTLDAQANQLARHLQRLRIGRGARVLVLADRSIEQILALLAVLKAGAAFVPLDPSYPAGRRAQIEADCRADLTLLGPGQSASGPTLDLTQSAAWADLPSAPLPESAAPEEAVYLLYTSGSTGTPKGALLPHRGLTNLLAWSNRAFPLTANDRLLQKTPCGFDAAIWEFFWPLTAGASLVLAAPDAHFDPVALVETVRQEKITLIQFVPTLLQAFLDIPDAAACTSLRHIFCGGGVLTPALLAQCRAVLPQARVHNVYGPTETSVDCIAWTAPNDADPDGAIPIGRPIDGMRIRLLNGDGQPVPIGVAGEIHIAGPGVGLGYFGRPDLTAAQFYPDPEVPGGTVYRSGDLGRFRADGQIEFLGRRDHQVKLRGFRIELGDIEAQSAAHPLVETAVALVGPGATRLSLFYTGTATADALREHLLDRLPVYMVPDRLISLAQLPLMPNGKIDRSALAAQAEAAPVVVNQASPRDQIELTLYGIWKTILLHPAIGIRDNFFTLGGSSIAAIKMAHAIEAAFGVRVPIKEILRHPTIEALGGWVRAGGRDPGPESPVIRLRAGSGGPTVICIHPAGGTAFCYLALAKVLPESFGVYGIQSPGLNPGEARLPSVTAMAETYLTLIAEHLDGPLILTGLSFGGLIAYDMARRLAARGKRDVSTVLLDTQGTMDEALRRSISTVDLPEFRAKLVKFNGMYPGIDDGQIQRYFEVYNHNRLTVGDYDFPDLPGRLVFVQARSGLTRAELKDQRRFWRERTRGDYLTKLVKGDHWEMLENEEIFRVARLMEREALRMATTHPVRQLVGA
jgi:amino acid adenylation domain-containing protein